MALLGYPALINLFFTVPNSSARDIVPTSLAQRTHLHLVGSSIESTLSDVSYNPVPMSPETQLLLCDTHYLH